MRSLSLHVSALNDDEYTLFTSSFADLIASDLSPTSDDDFEKQTVSLREARAWLRGRYSDLPVADLDAVRTPILVPSYYPLPWLFRSYASSPQIRGKNLSLAEASFLPSYALCCTFAVVQSLTETSCLNKVCPSSLTFPCARQRGSLGPLLAPADGLKGILLHLE